MTPSEDPLVTANRREQEELYGATLEARLGALTRAYGISQRRLARALGISAPMLSQLISGQRVKMGNPLAHERMAVLEQRAEEPLDAETSAGILAEVESSDIATTTQMRARRARVETGADSASESLRLQVSPAERRAARDLLAAHGVAPQLQTLLEQSLR